MDNGKNDELVAEGKLDFEQLQVVFTYYLLLLVYIEALSNPPKQYEKVVEQDQQVCFTWLDNYVFLIHVIFILIEPEEPVPIRYADLYKREKAQLEVIDLFKKKKSFPIAPDGNFVDKYFHLKTRNPTRYLALIPNSSCRTVFKIEPVKPVEVAAFRLRLVFIFKFIEFQLFYIIYVSVLFSLQDILENLPV